MKRFLKTIIFLIISLICLGIGLNILGFSVPKISEQELANYSEYYFSQLDLDEKSMYIKIDKAIKEKQQKVQLGFYKNDNIMDKAARAFEAYFYDYPENYHISNKYAISVSDLKIVSYATMQLDYTVNSDYEIELMNRKMQLAIEELLSNCITQDMTDFEKEIAIHDALVNHISYYEYETIEAIPFIKHTAYGALVEKEAVCDGYSKAFKIMLKQAGINSIIISGSTDNTNHAWNLVELNNSYYHVDVTSNKIEENEKKYPIHTYFNVNDSEISKTHKISSNFNYPASELTEYEYYIKNGYCLKGKDNLYNKLKDIIKKQKDLSVLEIKVQGEHSATQIIDTLYNLNFANWRFDGKTSISYTKIQDRYIFVK